MEPFEILLMRINDEGVEILNEMTDEDFDNLFGD